MPGQLFLTSEAFLPISPCCLAVANINAGSTTTSICRSLCRRFQQAASGLGVSPDKAKELSQLCGVSTTDEVGDGNVVVHVTMNKHEEEGE
ncbi:hypothetical protein Gogos_022096 [Gossypium gossypioides]|uniref:Uncharacterized protein n=1 Tax=Gossypium gossypioides TaxID=34282 RepID=A0A7J9D1P8_GOSGO|nr:hypothetical protein [Gossypium gossypioides]